MLHKLLLASFLFGANICTAQTVAPVEMDLKATGAPMPPLRLGIVVDSLINLPTNTTGKTYPKVGSILNVGKESAKPMPGAATADGKPKHKSRMERKKEKEAEKNANPSGPDFDNGANLFVMMFNPTCSHCEDETESIEKNIGLFKKSKWVLVANPSMIIHMPSFIKNLHISDYKPLYIGIDSSNFIDKIYRYSSLPQVNVYDGHHKLLKIYNGEVPIDSLKQYIQ